MQKDSEYQYEKDKMEVKETIQKNGFALKKVSLRL